MIKYGSMFQHGQPIIQDILARLLLVVYVVFAASFLVGHGLEMGQFFVHEIFVCHIAYSVKLIILFGFSNDLVTFAQITLSIIRQCKYTTILQYSNKKIRQDCSIITFINTVL